MADDARHTAHLHNTWMGYLLLPSWNTVLGSWLWALILQAPDAKQSAMSLLRTIQDLAVWRDQIEGARLTSDYDEPGALLQAVSHSKHVTGSEAVHGRAGLGRSIPQNVCESRIYCNRVTCKMSQAMGNIVNRPILAVPVRLAVVAAFAATLPDRRKGLPARADP